MEIVYENLFNIRIDRPKLAKILCFTTKFNYAAYLECSMYSLIYTLTSQSRSPVHICWLVNECLFPRNSKIKIPTEKNPGLDENINQLW